MTKKVTSTLVSLYCNLCLQNKRHIRIDYKTWYKQNNAFYKDNTYSDMLCIISNTIVSIEACNNSEMMLGDTGQEKETTKEKNDQKNDQTKARWWTAAGDKRA